MKNMCWGNEILGLYYKTYQLQLIAVKFRNPSREISYNLSSNGNNFNERRVAICGVVLKFQQCLFLEEVFDFDLVCHRMHRNWYILMVLIVISVSQSVWCFGGV
jgi:hypothetical protein